MLSVLFPKRGEMAELLKRDLEKFSRYNCLREMAERQLTRLNSIDAEKGFRKLEAKNEQTPAPNKL